MKTPSPVTAVFSNGSSVPLRPGFVRVMFHNHRFQIFMIFCISFFAITRPYRAHASLDTWQSISIVVAMGALVFAIYLIAFAILIRFGQRLRIRRFYTIWLVMLSSFLATFVGEWSVSVFDGPRLPLQETTMLWGFHFAVFAGLEVLFGIFVLPDLAAPDREAPDTRPVPLPPFVEQAMRRPSVDTPPEALPRTAPAQAQPPAAADIPAIVISDRRFPARAIRWVSSQEHYISISMFDGETQFLRGRIRDFLGQVPEDLGYCIHRSHWVSWSGIRQVETSKDYTTVTLDDRTELPVARGRRSDFIARWQRRNRST